MGKRFLLSVCAAVAVAGAQTAPRTPAPPLAFEVASIKPAEPLDAQRLMSGQQRITVNVDAARADFRDFSLAELIRAAYRVRLYQVSGPDWVTTTRFDVVAKLPEGVSAEQVPEMLKQLLAERFHLAVHSSSKEMPVYALAIGKEGSKLKESTPATAADGTIAAQAAAPPAAAGARTRSTMSVDAPTGSTRMSVRANGLHVDMMNMTMASLIDWLSRFTDRPVVDTTELKGRYDLELDLSRDEMLNAASNAGMAVDSARRVPDGASDPGGDSVFKSVEKFGLKLDPRRLPLTLLVVDHMDRTPTEN